MYCCATTTGQAIGHYLLLTYISTSKVVLDKIYNTYEIHLSDEVTYDKEVLKWQRGRVLLPFFLQCLCPLQNKGGHLVPYTESRPTNADPSEMSGSLLWPAL